MLIAVTYIYEPAGKDMPFPPGVGARGGVRSDMPFPPGVGGGGGSEDLNSSGAAVMGGAESESFEVITAEKALDASNVGNRMLRNMGWQEGSVREAHYQLSFYALVS